MGHSVAAIRGWSARAAASISAITVAAVGPTVAAPTASASQFDDWTVVASSSALTATASPDGRSSMSISGFDGCVTYLDTDHTPAEYRERCGEIYYVSDNVTGSWGDTPASNCFLRTNNGRPYCQRIGGFTVNANDQENWLYLDTDAGLSGYSVNADLRAGSDLVSISGPGAWTFVGGPGIDKLDLPRPKLGSGERVDEAWQVDLNAGLATPIGDSAVSDPVTATGFEDLGTNGGADVITGSGDDNQISSGAGDDRVDGSGGRDRIQTWSGRDVVHGGDGDDIVQSMEGDDKLFGDHGNDLIEDAGPASSYPDGFTSNDVIHGGPGDDVISAGEGDDEIDGGPGADRITCGPGDDTVTNAEFADTIAEDCEHVERGLEVKLTPYDADGEPIDGLFAPGQEILVEARIHNETGQELTDFSFEGGDLMTVDDRSPGGLEVVEGEDELDPAGLVLADGQSRTVSYTLTATDVGLAALNSKVTANNEDDEQQEGTRSLRVDIEDGALVDEVVGRWVLLQTIDRYLMKMHDEWLAGLDRRARSMYNAMRRELNAKKRKLYFGLKRGWQVSGGESVTALLRNMSDNAVAVGTPNSTYKGYTVEELNDAYDQAFMNEVGNGVRDYVDGWKRVGAKAKGVAKDAYAESLLATFWLLGTATPQERMEFEARMINFADLNTTSKNNLINTVKREIPRWKENGVYMAQAMNMAAQDVTLQSPDLQAQLAADRKWRENTLKLADKDPVRFQREWAKRDAEIFNVGGALIMDTVIGGGVQRLGGVRLGGRGVAVANAGESAGVITAKGTPVKGPRTAITPTEGPSAVSGGAASRTTEEFLSSVDGATVVKSSDYGNVYELPNTGGVPEVTLDVKAGILGELESEYLAATGERVKLVEVLKPSSPVRKPGGVAKLELTEQKTGKPSMLDAGAPDAVLGEASLWRNTTSPDKLPGWKQLGKARQQAAMAEWEKANATWDAWQNPEPGSKTARLQQCIGQEARVPLDPAPNQAGLQRFVTAEFEVVDVVQGTAEAKLIRVKKYVVEVVDTNRNQVVNGKTVVNEARAVPQTPDADAVAVGKAKLDAQGRPVLDAQGRPIVEPLTRAERDFVMQRYVDKNIKARRKGLMPDAAEHGVTLVMDDASAKAAGKLLPMYGAPFLPGNAGRDYLRRIAPFVAPKGVSADQMYRRMVNLVNSEGGFGQHAVVVTTDSRYLGEVAVTAW